MQPQLFYGSTIDHSLYVESTMLNPIRVKGINLQKFYEMIHLNAKV